MGVFSDIFGSKPSLPPWQTLNLGTEQQTAINNNIAAQPGAANLANLTETQIMSMLKQVIPNWDQISGASTGNIESLLKGQIPTDVSAAVSRSAAASSLAGGYGGTGLGRSLEARDLGLTSLDLTSKGLSSAESWMASTERLLSPAEQVYTNMFVTPGQQAAFDVNERNMKFESQWLGSQISAMPDPVTSGIFHFFDGTTLLGRNAPQQTGQNPPQYQPDSATTGGNDWSSGWSNAPIDDGSSTANNTAYGASDAAVGSASAAGAADVFQGGVDMTALEGFAALA